MKLRLDFCYKALQIDFDSLMKSGQAVVNVEHHIYNGTVLVIMQC